MLPAAGVVINSGQPSGLVGIVTPTGDICTSSMVASINAFHDLQPLCAAFCG